jgi:hypothetical protein
MTPKGKDGKFISPTEHRLNELVARGVMVEVKNPRCKIGRVRLTRGAWPIPHNETMDEADMAASGLKPPAPPARRR